MNSENLAGIVNRESICGSTGNNISNSNHDVTGCE